MDDRSLAVVFETRDELHIRPKIKTTNDTVTVVFVK